MHAVAKIMAKHAGRAGAEVGEILDVTPDYMMLNDRGAARAAALFREMGGEKVYYPDRVVVVFDHHYPAIRVPDAEAQRRTRAWIKDQGITRFHPGEGIGHVLFPEKGYVFPGALIFGTDSHTVTNSAFGCVSTGLGHSDVASFLALGHNWVRVPEVIRFDLHGKLRPWVTAKDITLRILEMFGEDAANYRAVEFAGPAITNMSMEDRLTLCNMTIDFGAKTGYVQPDEVTFRWLEDRVPREQWDVQTTDSDSNYVQVIDINLDEVKPIVAVPHNLSVIKSAADLPDVQIDEAIFGTCTNGRISDFRIAAAIMKGKKLAPHTRMMVNPGSREVYQQAIKEGLIEIMVEAGATIGVPGCGPCSGCHQGMLGAGENAISTASRNFRGRNGSPDAGIYVASPATVAASAIAGRIVTPEEVAGMMEDQ
jgi:3-isopropylmalate/(R)-2-methylmalate dehydratase large subunit